jgi:hypothetical protein
MGIAWWFSQYSGMFLCAFLRTHTMKPHTLSLLSLPALLAASCATVSESGTTYNQASGGSAVVNGAMVGGQFIPTGSNSARFALFATGRSRVHDKMVVHGLNYRWSSGVTDTVPDTRLGKSHVFRNTMVDNVTQATLHAPGELRADPGRESSVTVNADVSVTTTRATERRTIALRFDRSNAQDRLRSATTREAIVEMRRYGIPASDLDIGANRTGWTP